MAPERVREIGERAEAAVFHHQKFGAIADRAQRIDKIVADARSDQRGEVLGQSRIGHHARPPA